MTSRFAICSEVFKTPIEETIQTVARIGFDGLEVAPFNLAESADDVSPTRRREVRQAASDVGLELIGLHWLLVSPRGLHITTPDAAVRARTSAYMVALAHLAADLGGTFLVLGSPRQRNLEPGDDPSDAMRRAAEALRPAAEACGERGVRLLLEPLHPQETNFLRTVEEARALAALLDHPSVGYILDCKAMSGMPLEIIGTILAHGHGAGHFHSNCPDGLGPGMGSLDFRPILSALRKSGYDGWISTEPFQYEPDPETVAETALRTLREASLYGT